ncbi:MAG: glycosyltransferase [Nitrospira sp.]|nr:glycosyltransferase [Nitrospira sp.]
MKIAQVMLDPNYGGAQRYFADLCLELAGRGHSVLSIIRKNSVLEPELVSMENIKVVAVNNLFGWYDPFATNQIKIALNRFQPNIVETHLARAAFLTGKTKPAGKWPLITKTHGNINGKYYRNMDFIVPTTVQAAKSEYHRNVPQHKFSTVIPNLARLKPVSTVVKPTRIEKIFAAGRFVKKKGFNILLQALAELKSMDINFSLQIAGDGPEFNSLKALSTELGLNENVQFLGRRNDIPDLIKNADLFVLSSLSDHFPIIVLEAMAMGTPIVATRCEEGHPLDALDEESAILVDKGEKSALFHGLRKAIQDPESCGNRAQNALTVYKNCYAADAVVPKILALYDGVIQQFECNNGTRH